MPKFAVTTMSLAALALSCAQNCSQLQAQGPSSEDQPAACAKAETVITGTIVDSTRALIPGADISLDGATHVTSGADGHFRLPCAPSGPHHLTATATGFGTRELDVTTPHPAALTLTLNPAAEAMVDVDATDANAIPDANMAGPSVTISGKQLQQLADDPDDLLRELQQLAAATGGNPANTTIAVDGFQGSSALPPKSSIAYIKINPDQFAAEYREPPFDGGRVEVYTKPGAKTYHGALFLTNGSPFENARDPFSTSKAAIGKQRYGFELSGPVRRQGSDFALSLEHRIINNFAVVDAFMPTASGETAVTQNVATPQHLWLATARVDWQLGPKNTFILSYSANANTLQNVGVGGTSLAASGYNSDTYEHLFRVVDVTTVNARLMHESRLGIRFDGENDSPLSTAPQISVAGAFTGGGASIGPQRIHETNIEFDDDVIFTPRNHTMKFGAQMQAYIEHRQLTSGFNGTYVFTSPQQYLSNTPYAYTGVAGNPTVNFTQQRNALFFEDDWNVGKGVHIAYGARYFFEINPTLLGGVTPRLGILWSPNKKGTWTLHAHAGTFTGQLGVTSTSEIYRENGTSRITSTAYNPVDCAATNTPNCNPLANTTVIHSQREFASHAGNTFWSAENIGGTRVLPFGFNLSIDYYLARIWDDFRTVNLNSPLNGQPTGPRPLTPNTNILQTQNSGQGGGTAVFAGLENHKLKRLQFFFGGVRVNLVDEADDNPLSTPQSTYSTAGEYAHRSGQGVWQIFGSGTLTLPKKIEVSTNFNGSGDAHYNITTGSDNNGDGNFNDRPEYATPGQAGAIQTKFGLLTAQYTGQPTQVTLPRNTGVIPWNFFVDGNIQRVFSLNRNAKADHPQAITVNIRSSNLINHLNVTSVGGVLGSPLFGVAYAASNGRRIEAGLRYSF